MGIFGIKTKKEKRAEARAIDAKKEDELLADIKYWPIDQCRTELKQYEAGNREEYSLRVVDAIKSRKLTLGNEAGEASKRNKLDREIAAKEAEIERLKNRDPWTYSGGDGYHFKTRSDKNDKAMAEEVRAAQAELNRLKRERDNVGKEW